MDSEETTEEISRLQALIAAEEEKEKSYKAENARRRHNYIPFIVELMKILAREGKLVGLVQEVYSQAIFSFFLFCFIYFISVAFRMLSFYYFYSNFFLVLQN